MNGPWARLEKKKFSYFSWRAEINYFFVKQILNSVLRPANDGKTDFPSWQFCSCSWTGGGRGGGYRVSVVSKSHILDRVILAFEALHLNNKANLKIASVPLCCSFTDVCCNINALISSLTNLNCFNIYVPISRLQGEIQMKYQNKSLTTCLLRAKVNVQRT